MQNHVQNHRRYYRKLMKSFAIMTAVCVASQWTMALLSKCCKMRARENTTFNNMFLLQTHFITSVECLK